MTVDESIQKELVKQRVTAALDKSRTFMDFAQALDRRRCPRCSGSGVCSSRPGSEQTTNWDCRDCSGTGWKKEVVSGDRS